MFWKDTSIFVGDFCRDSAGIELSCENFEDICGEAWIWGL